VNMGDAPRHWGGSKEMASQTKSAGGATGGNSAPVHVHESENLCSAPH